MSENSIARDYNCAQKTFSAFAEDLELDLDQAYRLTACFGGGMSRGQVCGCVTGGLMAIGLRFGSDDPEDMVAKGLCDQAADRYLKEFEARFGSILCKELLGIEDFTPENRQAARDNGVMASRCPAFMAGARELLTEILKD